jgi:hypothetical protein
MVAVAAEGKPPCPGRKCHRKERRGAFGLTGGELGAGNMRSSRPPVTRDGSRQIDIKETMQCALERAAVGAFGWLKPTLADERLDFAVAQLNGHADELVGTRRRLRR